MARNKEHVPFAAELDFEPIDPSIQIDYPYSKCKYTSKVITKRGTIAAYVKTADQ